jgi:hypothetical protein
MKNNFDFFVGEWTSKQRRLREVLNNCEEWYEFTGTTKCWSVFHGAGSVDEVTLSLGFSGLTVRFYDEKTELWSLYWGNSRSGLALPPCVGRFDDDGVGTFTSDEIWEGRQIRVRYLWSAITDNSCRWEQAFSTDEGVTWETNWVSDFQRIA